MLPISERLVTELAKKGKATGPVCKIASEVTLVLLPMGISACLHDGHYLVAAIVTAVALTGLPELLSVPLIAWLFWQGSPMPALVLASRVVSGLVAVYAGLAHARKTLASGHATIGPLVGDSLLPVSALLALTLALVPWLRGTWLTITVVTAGALLTCRVIYVLCRLYPVWHRLHCPMMHTYAVTLALAMNRRDAEGEYPDTDAELGTVVEEAAAEMLSLSYQGSTYGPLGGVAAVLSQAHARASQYADASVSEHESSRTLRYLFMRAVIHEVIAGDYGQKVAADYWAAVMVGRAP